MTSGGEVDTVLVYGESGVVTLTNGGAPVTIFNNYNFTTSGGIFSLDVEPTSDKYGTGIITFTIVGTPDGDLSGELQIDTRLMEKKISEATDTQKTRGEPDRFESGNGNGYTHYGTDMVRMLWMD